MSQVFEAKTKDELSSMDLPELITYVGNLTAEVEHKDDEHKQTAKKAMEDKDKEHKDAMEDHEKEAKRAMDEKHEKMESKLAGILKAMDEEDPEKRKKAIKSAMEEHEKEKEGKSADHLEHEKKDAQEEKEEKKAMKAEITYLANIINKPKIDLLTKVYTAAQTPKKDLDEYIADWNAMTTKQLDAAVKLAQPVADSVGAYEAEVPKSPFGWTSQSIPTTQESFSASKKFKDIDNMTPDQAFDGGHIYA